MFSCISYIQVEYSGGYEIINPHQFGQQFVDRVANCKDLLLFYRKRAFTSKGKDMNSLHFNKGCNLECSWFQPILIVIKLFLNAVLTRNWNFILLSLLLFIVIIIIINVLFGNKPSYSLFKGSKISWNNGPVVKAPDSQSRGPVFKSTEWLPGQLSLSSFWGRSNEISEISENLVIKSKLPPCSGSVALRQLNPIRERRP